MAETSQTLIEQLKRLKSKNDWLGIYRKFQPITELSQNDLIWNNSKILSDIGFACAKLAETGPKELSSFRDQNRKNDFLKQQAEYRKHAVLTRKRCIEIDPRNASYRSDLAYTYYQNINELTQPRGRRDGNLRKEIENFLKTVDKTLDLQPNRVQDLYRKGRILTDVLPNQILWSRSYEDYGDFTEKSKKADELREQGICALLAAKELWENLRDESLRKRHRKDYIKSLYLLSQTYYNKIKQDWDESVFALNLRDDVRSDQQVVINKTDEQSIEQAIEMIKQCCKTDCPPELRRSVKAKQQNLEKLASHNGIEEGTNKLYSIGKFFLAQYWILSGYGLKENDNAIKARGIAERYLQAALKCQWSPQKASQHKLFIVERLARIFISKGDYNQAVSIIEENTQKLKLKYADSYVLHTCALALLKSGRISVSQEVLDIATKSKGNMHIWSTHFLMGCTYLEENQLERAKRQFDLAHQEASRVGKKNIDSLLIGKASVAYKSADVLKALKFLEEAKRLNPNRISTSERIRRLQQSEA
ncbi:MAG: hypothetical protein OXU23_06375 [Candidatus Poribacteria bacterium]|nr:hypothetical protein [Candidatus Poribacteria bacterium]MDE0466626.1 hypothetical protein [Candidatus Poribacteria bacterium]